MKNIKSDSKAYWHCPEIRSHIRRLYLTKMASWLTFVVFSPLIILGIVAICLVHLFDYVGQFALWPAHELVDWLQDRQREILREGHSVLSTEEIQERIGKKKS